MAAANPDSANDDDGAGSSGGGLTHVSSVVFGGIMTSFCSSSLVLVLNLSMFSPC